MRNLISIYSRKPQHHITTTDFINGCNGPSHVNSIKFLCQEIPIRLSKQIVLLERMPYGFCRVPKFQNIIEWHHRSLHDITSFSTQDPENFREISENILRRHDKTLSYVAKGVLEFQENIA